MAFMLSEFFSILSKSCSAVKEAVKGSIKPIEEVELADKLIVKDGVAVLGEALLTSSEAKQAIGTIIKQRRVINTFVFIYCYPNLHILLVKIIKKTLL